MIHFFTDTVLAYYSLKRVAGYRNITNWKPSCVYTYQLVHLDWLWKFHACYIWSTLHSPWWICCVALTCNIIRIKLCIKESRSSVSPSVLLNWLRHKEWTRMGLYNTMVKYILLSENLRRNLDLFQDGIVKMDLY